LLRCARNDGGGDPHAAPYPQTCSCEGRNPCAPALSGLAIVFMGSRLRGSATVCFLPAFLLRPPVFLRRAALSRYRHITTAMARVSDSVHTSNASIRYL
jgi:hypothetical protein